MNSLPPAIGRYRILRELGRGAMGVVYLAADPVIGREVAIKVLWPGTSGSDESDRLVTEARVAGRLTHPYIVPVFDVGEDGGQPFVVMQYVEGRTLARVLGDPTRPPLGIKLQWMGELCDGLDYAHRQRVIHRDIKPSNLLVDARRSLRILDFGVAKLLSTSQINFTSIGTPAYMAPEQYSRAPVDSRTDVFAAGLVLFELITHRRALVGDSAAQILGQLMMGPMPRLAEVEPGVDPELAAICDRAIARDPADRFQTARDLGEALAAVQARKATARVLLGQVRAEPTAPSVDPPTAATVRAVGQPAPKVVPSRVTPPAAVATKASAWRMAITTTRWQFALPAAATSIIAVGLVLGPERSANQQPSISMAVKPLQTSTPTPATAAPPNASTVLPSPIESGRKPTTQAAGAHSIGRLSVSSDLDGTLFTTSPVPGRGEIALSPLNVNALPPAHYEVRAAYFDRDPFMGDVARPTTARQRVDVVAGKTATVRFGLEAPLWRDRFERALVIPPGRGRSASLNRTYLRLQELRAASANDDARYAKAASEQQLVTIVAGDIASDSDLGPLVRRGRFDVRIDEQSVPLDLLASAVSANQLELSTGTHRFRVVADMHYGNRSFKGTSCSGSFDVAGGVVARQLKLDLLFHNAMSGSPERVDCQLGQDGPLRPTSSSISVSVVAESVPVPNARVRLFRQTTDLVHERHADGQGRVTFGNLSPGAYDVLADAEGFLGRREPTRADPSTPLTRVTTVLRRVGGKTQSSDDGSFALALPAGVYQVVASPPSLPRIEYEGARYPQVTISDQHGALLQFKLTALRSRAQENTTTPPVTTNTPNLLKGVVTNGQGKPLAGVEVVAVLAR